MRLGLVGALERLINKPSIFPHLLELVGFAQHALHLLVLIILVGWAQFGRSDVHMVLVLHQPLMQRLDIFGQIKFLTCRCIHTFSNLAGWRIRLHSLLN